MEIIMNDKEMTKAIYDCLDKYFNQQRQYASYFYGCIYYEIRN